MSAYDMTFSDAIYGKAPRYVSRERLVTMLDHEYELLVARLGEKRGATTKFFVFADTVAAKAYKGNNECHGWMGIRFQPAPGETTPSDVMMHVRMWDKDNVRQQEAIGIVGTNLIYAAFYLRENLEKFISSLADNVGSDRIEIDMLKFSGPAFATVDNRLMSLHLVRHGLTNAVMFGPNGDVLQPSEVLYKKAILVERGSFRPVTHVNVDMINCATAQFLQEPAVQGKDMIVLMEITMNNLLADGELDADDFLSRVDMLGDIGCTVLISNYSEYYRLTSYFRRYSKEMIGVAMGINNLLEIFNERYYEHLEGGILENFGRLFRNSVRLYVYPMQRAAYDRYLDTGHHAVPPAGAEGTAPRPSAIGAAPFAREVLINARNVQVAPTCATSTNTFWKTTTSSASSGLTTTFSISSPVMCWSASAPATNGGKAWSPPRWLPRSNAAASSAIRPSRFNSPGPWPAWTWRAQSARPAGLISGAPPGRRRHPTTPPRSPEASH